MRTPDEILKSTIGNLVFENAILQAKLEEAEAKIKELEKSVEAPKPE